MKTQITTLKPKKFEKSNDTGRVFCAKYMPNTTSTIYSGGWDRTIRFYDTRTGNIANTITGPEICGDSLDISGNILASGAWSTKDQIQLWDIRTLKCICNIKWDNKTLNEYTYIYSVKFNQRKDRKFLSIGAVNQPLFRIFDMSTFNSEDRKKTKNFPTPIFGCGENYKPCFTTDWVKIGTTKELFCCGCGDGGTRVYTIQTKSGY